MVTTAVSQAPTGEPVGAQKKRQIRSVPGPADRAFLGLTKVGALIVLAVIAAIGLFLSIRAFAAIRVAKLSFLTTQAWEPDVHHFGVAGILTGTILIAVVAVVIAVPIALGLSLFISEIAPQRIKRTLVSLVDLMAAIPSVVYGLWAWLFLEGRTIGLSRWISTWFGWIPIFKVNGADPTNPLESASVYSASTFIVGIAVSLMVIPILCSVMREAFSQAPLGNARVPTPWGPPAGG